MKPTRRGEDTRLVISKGLTRIFSAFAVQPGEVEFAEHLGAVSRAVTGVEPAEIPRLINAAVTALVDEWRPGPWRRAPAPAEVRSAIFQARAEFKRRVDAERRALPAARLEPHDVRSILDALAQQLHWSAEWRDDAKQTARAKIEDKVRELLAEADRERATAHRPAPGRRRREPRSG